MKKTIFIIICSVLILQSCKKEKIEFNPKNQLEKFSTVETQYFDLDTIEFMEIKGKKGTIIYYNRNDLELGENERVTFELKELYDFEDLFFNNINTITDKGELLESSGVLFLNFKSNDKKLNLKENKFLNIKLPEGKLSDNSIFSAQVDSINQFKWVKEKKQLFGTAIERRGRITIEFQVPIDSVNYYMGLQKQRDSLENVYNKEYAKTQGIIPDLFAIKLGWVNIDKLLKNVQNIAFKLELKNNDIEQMTFYTYYEGFNSFYSEFRTKDNLVFNDIPYIEGKTSIIALGNIKKQLYVDIIELNRPFNQILTIDFKKTDKDGIKKIIE